MTANEFNKKYKEFIEQRHYGCAINDEEAINYLDKEFEELIKIPKFKFSQIKTKFGFFRVYCTNVSQEKLEEMEIKLYEICPKISKKV